MTDPKLTSYLKAKQISVFVQLLADYSEPIWPDSLTNEELRVLFCSDECNLKDIVNELNIDLKYSFSKDDLRMIHEAHMHKMETEVEDFQSLGFNLFALLLTGSTSRTRCTRLRIARIKKRIKDDKIDVALQGDFSYRSCLQVRTVK